MTHLFAAGSKSPWLAAAVMFSLVGCGAPHLQPPGPLVYPRSPQTVSALGTAGPEERRTALQIDKLPGQPTPAGTSPLPPQRPARTAATPGNDDPVSIAIEQTPLPVFIQILYGSVLKLPYSLDAAVQARTELVTFKTSRPLPASHLQAVAISLLRSYGLAVQELEGLVRITPEGPASNTSTQLRRGRSLPDTPEPLRTAFQHIEFEIVRSTEALQWLKQILGTRVSATDDPGRNGLLLSGTQADLRAAIELIQALDQPRMRGRVARRIAPAFANATEFSQRLVEMLSAQGYAASSTMSTSMPILVLPIPAINSVIVFTGTESVMEHVLRWAAELDRPPTGSTSNALFTYSVKYADAQELSKTLGELLGGGGGGGGTAAAGSAATRSSGSGRVVVDKATNTLIFRGSNAEEYQQIQTLLRELDRPTKSALIEVLVAEVRRDSLQSLGMLWDFNRFGLGSAAVGTAAFGSSGLALAFTDSSQRLRSSINALASNNQAKVLSNPKVMARNGETATIQVGQEVPVITSQQTTGTSSGGGLFTGSTPNVLQTVQYRSTGVILKVRPVINSGNRLDLELEQEVSSAAKTETGVSSSPTISTRRVSTKLSLRDGSTVLLAGLISRNSSDGNAGVPLLKDIPGLGLLFGATSADSIETELLVMITPYVINDDFEAESISNAMQAGFGDWARNIVPARIDRSVIVPLSPTPPLPPLPAVGTPSGAAVPPPASTAPSATSQGPAMQDAPAAPALVDSGIITSRPTAAPPAAGANPPPAPGPAASTSAGKAPAPAKPAAATSGGAAQPIKGGVVVDDEEARAAIQRLLEKR